MGCMTTFRYDDEGTIALLQNKSKPSYSFLPIASLYMKIWTIEEEAERLAKRFHGLNRAAFARDYGVSGGQSMIYQHITGRRPISLEAAQSYARGFSCSLADISPRLAEEAKKAALSLGEIEFENEEVTLTDEQKRVLALVSGIRKEARDAWIKIGVYLSDQVPERRKQDVEHEHDRRVGPKIPPDTFDLTNYDPNFDNDENQSKERKKK